MPTREDLLRLMSAPAQQAAAPAEPPAPEPHGMLAQFLGGAGHGVANSLWGTIGLLDAVIPGDAISDKPLYGPGGIYDTGKWGGGAYGLGNLAGFLGSMVATPAGWLAGAARGAMVTKLASKALPAWLAAKASPKVVKALEAAGTRVAGSATHLAVYEAIATPGDVRTRAERALHGAGAGAVFGAIGATPRLGESRAAFALRNAGRGALAGAVIPMSPVEITGHPRIDSVLFGAAFEPVMGALHHKPVKTVGDRLKDTGYMAQGESQFRGIAEVRPFKEIGDPVAAEAWAQTWTQLGRPAEVEIVGRAPDGKSYLVRAPGNERQIPMPAPVSALKLVPKQRSFDFGEDGIEVPGVPRGAGQPTEGLQPEQIVRGEFLLPSEYEELRADPSNMAVVHKARGRVLPRVVRAMETNPDAFREMVSKIIDSRPRLKEWLADNGVKITVTTGTSTDRASANARYDPTGKLVTVFPGAFFSEETVLLSGRGDAYGAVESALLHEIVHAITISGKNKDVNFGFFESGPSGNLASNIVHNLGLRYLTGVSHKGDKRLSAEAGVKMREVLIHHFGEDAKVYHNGDVVPLSNRRDSTRVLADLFVGTDRTQITMVKRVPRREGRDNESQGVINFDGSTMPGIEADRAVTFTTWLQITDLGGSPQRRRWSIGLRDLRHTEPDSSQIFARGDAGVQPFWKGTTASGSQLENYYNISNPYEIPTGLMTRAMMHRNLQEFEAANPGGTALLRAFIGETFLNELMGKAPARSLFGDPPQRDVTVPISVDVPVGMPRVIKPWGLKSESPTTEAQYFQEKWDFVYGDGERHTPVTRAIWNGIGGKTNLSSEERMAVAFDTATLDKVFTRMSEELGSNQPTNINLEAAFKRVLPEIMDWVRAKLGKVGEDYDPDREYQSLFGERQKQAGEVITLLDKNQKGGGRARVYKVDKDGNLVEQHVPIERLNKGEVTALPTEAQDAAIAEFVNRMFATREQFEVERANLPTAWKREAFRLFFGYGRKDETKMPYAPEVDHLPHPPQPTFLLRMLEQAGVPDLPDVATLRAFLSREIGFEQPRRKVDWGPLFGGTTARDVVGRYVITAPKPEGYQVVTPGRFRIPMDMTTEERLRITEPVDVTGATRRPRVGSDKNEPDPFTASIIETGTRVPIGSGPKGGQPGYDIMERAVQYFGQPEPGVPWTVPGSSERNRLAGRTLYYSREEGGGRSPYAEQLPLFKASDWVRKQVAAETEAGAESSASQTAMKGSHRTPEQEIFERDVLGWKEPGKQLLLGPPPERPPQPGDPNFVGPRRVITAGPSWLFDPPAMPEKVMLPEWLRRPDRQLSFSFPTSKEAKNIRMGKENVGIGSEGITPGAWKTLSYVDKMRHILLRLQGAVGNDIRWQRTMAKYVRLMDEAQMGGLYPMFRAVSMIKGEKDFKAVDQATRFLLDNADRLQVEITHDGKVFKVRELDSGVEWEAAEPGALALGLDMRQRALNLGVRELTPPGGEGVMWSINAPGGPPAGTPGEPAGLPNMRPEPAKTWLASMATYIKDVRSNLVALTKQTGDQRIFDYVNDMMTQAQFARERAETLLMKPFLSTASSMLGTKAKVFNRRQSMVRIGKALAEVSDNAEMIGNQFTKGSAEGNAAADAWIQANRDRIYSQHGLTPQERQFATYMMDEWFPKAAVDAGIPESWVWRGYLPRLESRLAEERGAFDYFDVLKQKRDPTDFFALHERDPNIQAANREYDIHTLAEAYAYRGMRHKYLGDVVDPTTGEVAAKGVLSRVHELMQGYRLESGEWSPGFLPVAISYNASVGRVSPRRARAMSVSRGITERNIGRVKGVQEHLPDPLATALQPLVDRLQLRLDSRDITLWVDYVLTLNRAKVFGLHPMRTVRQVTGPLFFTLPRVGPRAFGQAVKEITNKELRAGIRQRAEAAGVLTGSQPDMYLSTRNPLLRVADDTMKPYAAVDALERMLAFRSQEILTQKAVERFQSHHNEETFIQESRLWTLDPVFRESVLGHLRRGDYEGTVTKHAQLLTAHTVMDYSRMNNPYWADGVWGKLFGQYGRWPLAAFEIVTAMAKHGTYQQRAEMIALYAMVAAGVYSMGQAFGLDTRDWIPAFHSSYWAGGPQLSNLVGVTAWAGGQPGAGGSLARNLRDDPIVGSIGFLYKQFMPAGDVMGQPLVDAMDAVGINVSRRRRRMWGLPDPQLSRGNVHGFLAHTIGFKTTYDPQPKIRNIFWEPTMQAAAPAGDILRELTAPSRDLVTGGRD